MSGIFFKIIGHDFQPRWIFYKNSRSSSKREPRKSRNCSFSFLFLFFFFFKFPPRRRSKENSEGMIEILILVDKVSRKWKAYGDFIHPWIRFVIYFRRLIGVHESNTRALVQIFFFFFAPPSHPLLFFAKKSCVTFDNISNSRFIGANERWTKWKLALE